MDFLLYHIICNMSIYHRKQFWIRLSVRIVKIALNVLFYFYMKEMPIFKLENQIISKEEIKTLAQNLFEPIIFYAQ